jgi:transcriptional regulator of acetoin/glycerol metabolism
MPSELIEAELFGAEAGAYTGATRRAKASLKRPTAARCSSTKSATCRWPAK